MQEEFKGFCLMSDGKWTPPVTLNGAHEVVRYVNLQKVFAKEVRIVDSEDYVVMQAINGRIVLMER